MTAAPPQNLTTFLDNIPADFDGWSINDKLTYFADYLLGFTELPTFLKDWVLKTLAVADIKLLFRLTEEALGEDSWLTWDNATTVAFRTMYNIFIYEETTPATTTSRAYKFCNEDDYVHSMSLKILIGPAAFLIFLLAFIPTRKRLFPNCCWNKPAVLYPVDFISDRSHRLPYAAVFAVLSYKAVMLFGGSYFWKPEQFDDDDWMKKFGWTKVFVVLINIMLLGVCVYPMLVFISKRRYIYCNILGIAGCIVWSAEEVVVIWGCLSAEHQEYQTIPQLSVQFPVLLLYAILLVVYAIDLVKNILLYMNEQQSEDEYTLEERELLNYLSHLLNREEYCPPTTIKEKIKSKLYRKLKGYRYSPRMLCTLTLGLMSLYQLAVYFAAYARFWSDELLTMEDDVEEVLDALNVSASTEVVVDHINTARYVIEVSCYVAAAIETLLMVHALTCYRRHVRKMYGGNRKWYGDRDIQPQNTLVNGMRYSGYQVAYLLYGYIILFFFLIIVLLFICYMIILPLKHGYKTVVIEKIIQLWPSILISLALYHSQMLLARFCFLQERGAVFALDNRRAYHVVSFFMFFFNIVVGLFSCLRRIVISLVLGVALVSRLDRCLLMKGFEKMDSGFNTYICMIKMDVQHNHPVMKAFIFVLKEAVKKRQQAYKKHVLKAASGSVSTGDVQIRVDDERAFLADAVRYQQGSYRKLQVTPNGTPANGTPANGTPNGSMSDRLNTSGEGRPSVNILPYKDPSKYRNKWWKAITMYNNPSTVLDRLQARVEEAKKQHNMADKANAVDAVVNAGSVLLTGTTMAGTLGALADDDIGVPTKTGTQDGDKSGTTGDVDGDSTQEHEGDTVIRMRAGGDDDDDEGEYDANSITV